MLASASSSGTLKLWDIATNTCVATLRGRTACVNSCAFSPDGKMLASAGSFGDLKLWDIATNTCVATLSGHTSLVNSCAFSPDGKMLASASNDKTLKLWDIATNTCVATLSGHTKVVESCAFSPDGKMLASTSWDTTLKLWDIATNTCVATLSGHTSFANSCAFSPDGKMLASASNDDTLKLWDIATTTCVATLHGHTDSVKSCAFSPDGKMLASASNDKTMKLWDIATNTCVATLHGHTGSVKSCAFGPDGKVLASASNDNTLKLWNTHAAIAKAKADAVAAKAKAEADAAAAKAKAVADAAAAKAKADDHERLTNWLRKYDLEHLENALEHHLGVKKFPDLLQLTAADLKPCGNFKVAEINRFMRGVKETLDAAAAAARASSTPVAVASTGRSFEPRVFPPVDASVNEMDGHGEALVTMHMRVALGFDDAVPTGCAAAGEFPVNWDELRSKAVSYVRQKDGGIDVVSTAAVAQVKSKFRSATSRGEVAQLKGDTEVAAHAGKKLLFYAVSYAAGVTAYADEVGIALFTFTANGLVSPANRKAEQLQNTAAQQQPGELQTHKRKRADPPPGVWSSWNKDQVATWLESEGFEHYVPCFSMVEGSDLKALTRDDFAGLPPPAFSPFVANKLLAAIAKL